MSVNLDNYNADECLTQLVLQLFTTSIHTSVYYSRSARNDSAAWNKIKVGENLSTFDSLPLDALLRLGFVSDYTGINAVVIPLKLALFSFEK